MNRMLIFFLCTALSTCFADTSSSSSATVEEVRNNSILLDDEYYINLMLYTRKNPKEFMLLQLQNEDSIKRSNFDGSKGLKIVIHGWLRNYLSPACIQLRDVFLKKYDTNIILVDWSPLSQKNYITARIDIVKVGKVVAKLVDTLIEGYGLTSDKVHILGHSLGAHIAGIAGLNTQTGNVSRVTGLDPAGPLFSEKEEERIRPESANFVDVIHTCGHVLGFLKPLGQVDFYPNKGVYKQPGCGIDYEAKCSHARSYIYYAESVFSNEFLSVQCEDWEAFEKSNCTLPPIPMGDNVPTTVKGNYYLRTNKRRPFAKGNIYN